MKSNLLFICIFLLLSSLSKATNYTISITGFTYSPANLIVNVGDRITIQASASHPLQQVSKTTWDVDGSDPLASGFSSLTDYSFTVTSGMAGSTIYYVCANHAAFGMKGSIDVTVPSGVGNEIQNSFNFAVFPNPVTSNASVSFVVKQSQKIQLGLYTSEGKLIETIANTVMLPGKQTIPLPVDVLQKGVYILVLNAGKETIRKKILLQ